MNKFKSLSNKNIDIINDPFIKISKEILSINNPVLNGSYIKYGKDKACDLDMYENIKIQNLTNRNDILQILLDKLIKNKKKTKLIRLCFYFNDDRIKNILNNLGYISGTLEIIDCNLDFNIDNTLPQKIKDKINKYKNKLQSDFNIKNYIKLHNYLYKLNNVSWKLSEFKKGYKIINGINIKLYDTIFKNVYIELLYDNYKITNYISFINYDEKNDQKKLNHYSADFYDIINNKKIFYYIILKKIQVFLKWGYFNKIFKEKELINNTINFYNEIYDFRENIGNKYFELCSIDNQILLTKNKEKLKKEYKKNFKKINKHSEKIYIKINKLYKKYLNLYLRFV
jgi:hypothetical protein